MKEDDFFLGGIADQIGKCRDRYVPAGTGFMDPRRQSLARLYCKKNSIPVCEWAQDGAEGENRPPLRAVFFGGYEDAERVVMLILPGYAGLGDNDPLTVIRAEKHEGGKELTHRDYLGSLLALGLKRESFGDILVREDGADIVALKEIAGFVLLNYTKAGQTPLSLSRRPISELIVPEPEYTLVTRTVASLRLDSVAASVFGLPRGKAAEAIKSGILFVNHLQVIKTDLQIKEGDVISLRGKGKARLAEISGKSRKGRQIIKMERY